MLSRRSWNRYYTKALPYCHADIKQEFRNDEGNPNEAAGAGLCLQLQDFATEALVESAGSLHNEIRIPATALCLYLQRAEEQAVMIKQEKGTVRRSKPWVRKRRRQHTPPEELDHKREKRFQKEENKAGEKAQNDDSSYKASSASDGE